MLKYNNFTAVLYFLEHRPSNRYCCYGNCAAGSKPIKKNFL